MNKKVVIGIFLVLVVAGFFYLFLEKNTIPPEPVATEPPPVTTVHEHEPLPLLPVESVAPNFSLTDINGKRIVLSEYQNRKMVLLEFFSTRCSHCIASIPTLKILQQEFPDQLQILAVNAGDDPSKPSTGKAFQKKYGITYPILDQPASALLEQYRIAGFPTFYLIDKHGDIRWNQAGALDYEEYQAISLKLKRSNT